jgi:hypothetical protein
MILERNLSHGRHQGQRIKLEYFSTGNNSELIEITDMKRINQYNIIHQDKLQLYIDSSKNS